MERLDINTLGTKIGKVRLAKMKKEVNVAVFHSHSFNSGGRFLGYVVRYTHHAGDLCGDSLR